MLSSALKPMPSWPWWLLPHIQREPSFLMAAVTPSLTLTAATFSITLTGTAESSREPLPSSP